MAYIPDAFAEFDRAALRALVTAHNFGLLIASDNTGMQVVHLPFLLDPERGHHGHLRCHVARANPIWRIVDTARLLAVFTGPHAYISPNWYRTPDLVPTWNYAAVYADGRGRVMDEPELDAALYDLAAQEEARLAAANPWTLDRISPRNPCGNAPGDCRNRHRDNRPARQEKDVAEPQRGRSRRCGSTRCVRSTVPILWPLPASSIRPDASSQLFTAVPTVYCPVYCPMLPAASVGADLPTHNATPATPLPPAGQMTWLADPGSPDLPLPSRCSRSPS